LQDKWNWHYRIQYHLWQFVVYHLHHLMHQSQFSDTIRKHIYFMSVEPLTYSLDNVEYKGSTTSSFCKILNIRNHLRYAHCSILEK
jgi:hypothetical protein